jgi:hypothetical protein
VSDWQAARGEGLLRATRRASVLTALSYLRRLSHDTKGADAAGASGGGPTPAKGRAKLGFGAAHQLQPLQRVELASGLLLASAAQAQAPDSTGPTPQAPAAVPLDGGPRCWPPRAWPKAYGLRYLRQRRKQA